MQPIRKLGAWCELEGEVDGQVNCRVSEFAVLTDGDEIVLHAERGFSSRTVPRPSDPFACMTVDSIEESVGTVLLPDDAEVTGEDHDWDWLHSLLGEHGILVTADVLRRLPYEIRLGPALTARLAKRAADEGTG